MNFEGDNLAPSLYFRSQASVLALTAVNFGGPFFIFE